MINPTNTPEATEEPEEVIEDETDLSVDEENDEADDTDEDIEVSPTAIPTEAPTATPYTERLYKENVEEYEDALTPYGISSEDLERFTHNSLLRNKLIEDMTKDMQPVEEQVWFAIFWLQPKTWLTKSSKNLKMAKIGTFWLLNIQPMNPIKIMAETWLDWTRRQL